jgi:carbamoyltransferase
MGKVAEHVDPKEGIEHLVLSGIHDLPSSVETHCSNAYVMMMDKFLYAQNGGKCPPYRWWDWKHNHHEMHTAQAFYNSGFEKAVVIVADGGGSITEIVPTDGGKQACEIESIFTAEYPAKFVKIHESNSNKQNISCGWKFEMISTYLGFSFWDAGKVMGLASYGKPNPNVPDLDDDTLFTRLEGFKCRVDLPRTFQNDADLAYELQTKTQRRILNLIKKGIEMSGCKNVIVVGGYGLNCVANYYYRKNLPDDVNLYVEPISHDAGTSIGSAKFIWHMETGDTTIRPLKHIYYGPKPSYENIESKLREGETIQDIDYDGVIDLILKGNIVALFQGSSEGGPRALGNRTLMFDPRIPNGKDIVNKIKGREHFRPFAGSCLEEFCQSWFDMAGMESSPFMMYAVDVWPEKIPFIQSIVHVDNTCRIQTVNEEQNYHWYNLIHTFHNKTGVPILFNTSFNLAGEPLVETVDDAIRTLRNSLIEYVYMPEIGKLITIKNG